MTKPEAVELVIRIQGWGQVDVPGYGTCTASPDNECHYAVVHGDTVQLVPEPTKNSWRFEGWRGGGCEEYADTCTISPITDTAVTSKFKRSD